MLLWSPLPAEEEMTGSTESLGCTWHWASKAGGFSQLTSPARVCWDAVLQPQPQAPRGGTRGPRCRVAAARFLPGQFHWLRKWQERASSSDGAGLWQSQAAGFWRWASRRACCSPTHVFLLYVVLLTVANTWPTPVENWALEIKWVERGPGSLRTQTETSPCHISHSAVDNIQPSVSSLPTSFPFSISSFFYFFWWVTHSIKLTAVTVLGG